MLQQITDHQMQVTIKAGTTVQLDQWTEQYQINVVPAVYSSLDFFSRTHRAACQEVQIKAKKQRRDLTGLKERRKKKKKRPRATVQGWT